MKVRTWCHNRAPAGWAEVLEQLQQFDSLAQSFNKGKKSDAERHSLYACHDQLIALATNCLATGTVFDLDDPLLDEVFIEGVLLTQNYYRELVDHPELEILDTAGSKTLSLFTPDCSGDAEDSDALGTRLRSVFQVDDVTLDEMKARLAEQTEPLRDRHKIVKALEGLFNLVSQNPQLDADVFRLFQGFYPDSPFQPGQVKLIKTASALFFCLPFNAETTPGWDDITEANKVQYKQFIQKIQRGEPFAHFPAFGPFKGTDAASDILDGIVNRSQLSYERVTTTLTRMVSILPMDEIDKFLIHDTWGHQWQESLLHFDAPYMQLARFNLPLSLQEQASVLGQQSAFADIFVKTKTGEITLDEEALRRFIDDEVYERSVIALTPVVAEILADIVEYKFLALHPEKDELLPSSSLFKNYPSKFDLTLQDLYRCFEQASQVFREWATSEALQDQMAAQILEALEVPQTKAENVHKVVQAAAHICEKHLADYYQPQWFWKREHRNRLRLNAFSLMALNLLSVHTVLLQTYQTLATTPASIPGMQSFKDLLVLTMGVFFERDPQRHLWLMDEFLTEGFLPRWERWIQQ